MSPDEVIKFDDAGHLVATIVLAFNADPFVRWLFPDPAQFLDSFTQITKIHSEKTAAYGGAYGRGDRRGAAFWYPPGSHTDGAALGAIVEKAGALERLSTVWEQVAALTPQEPHWYLRQIGIDPSLQGGGHGGRLIEAGLNDIDKRGEPAYLEATSERGKAFYKRHGFVVIRKVQVGETPALWPMLRAPR